LANTTTFFIDGINSDTRVTSALFQFGTADGNLRPVPAALAVAVRSLNRCHWRW
jgi:hypothetical protein